MKPSRPSSRLHDVARAAGVSTSTVSNTINRPEVVSPSTRRKVQKAIRELEFVPHQGAATLRTGSSRLIGLVVPDITNPFYSAIADGVTAAAEDLGYAVVLGITSDLADRERRHLDVLSQHRAAGALVVPRGADQTRLDRLRECGFPLVMVDRSAPEHVGCSSSIDDVRGGLLAARHLLATRGDILTVNGPSSIPQCRDRRAGVHQALAEADRDPGASVEINLDEMTADAAQKAIAQLLARGQAPVAIFCTNDLMAVGVVRALLAGGVPVPGRTAVVGYGDLAMAGGAPVPLTTVAQPMTALGRAALGQLLEEIEDRAGDHHHRATVFSPVLTIRESAPA